MASWGISFEEGQYVFAAFRYERLAGMPWAMPSWRDRGSLPERA